MKSKLLNTLLIITSLIGYLEWGGGNHTFLFQAEYDILTKAFTSPTSVIHPFTVLPLIGQIMLFVTLFQKNPSKILTYVSMFALGILLGFMLIIGLMSLNAKIICSTIPFMVVVVLAIVHYILK